ncbi:uncharacterized protein SPPG_00845 [Spizellomyces punctatus DAOM BR117]|uniref:RRM domain-containing protein n=1 Tax=Spizellomyces punctatus (strain DAOM BR117) TaxID=645134 RepID=A0A0L0HVP4_SPIPD|nr:uncharacterized protein SPPG_00845 [Spizellomyces punctatus DAOM BR117]KND05178.1 hypothetical protein SPPG_00845 [Spizellomyces punctatus DAOM BR117]|eukprot:XP_016613217.1 hypothetical protein SPPG_00845 [Spizellomyces punctatus DAOM BR117]
MDKMDLSLDEIIVKRPGKGSQRGGRNQRGRRTQRAAPYQRPTRPGNADGQWKHDLFEGGRRKTGDLRTQIQRPAVSGTLSDRVRGLVSDTIDTPRRTVQRNNAGGVMVDRLGPPVRSVSSKQNPIGSSGSISIKGGAGPAVIQIENLHPAATPEDIKTSLSPYGKIVDCTLTFDAQGRSSGVCTVTFERRDSAQNAINKLNGQIADGRVLRVTELQSKLTIAGAASVQKANNTATSTTVSNGGTMYADRLGPAVPASGRIVQRGQGVLSRVGGKAKSGRGGTTFSVSI